MLKHGRHAPPRLPSRRRALLLPSVLLVAGGTAFAGMAVLPAAAESVPPVPAPVQVEVVAAPPAHANAGLLRTLQTAATAAPSRAASRPPARPPARASRNRAPAPAAEPAPKPEPKPPAYVRPGTGRLTSSFGPRWGRLHAGLDLAAGVGAPISAVTRGTVLSAGTEGGYGNVVRLQHDARTVTVYAHLSAVLVTTGQSVGTGHVIGREGSTGHSTGPHLHFEVRVDGTPVDPSAWLRARGVAL